MKARRGTRRKRPTNSAVSPCTHELAGLLALNHLHLSLPNDPNLWADVLKDTSITQQPMRRIVAVVGAGASISAGLPTTKQAIERIKSVIGPQIERELDRLVLEYRLRRDEFETVLLAASRLNRDDVLDELRKLFSLRYRPSLTHEILAHLLKHRFVDAVINFNFDESLDHSLRDELGGPQNYLHVISDGDCPPVIERELNAHHRFSMPVYIKPHGTVSHKSTMRFTRGDYYLLPGDIKLLLQKLLSDMPICLIVIGFNMQSFEFNDIVARCMKSKDDRIYTYTCEPRPTHDPDFWEPVCNDDGSVRLPGIRALYSRKRHGHIDPKGQHTLDVHMRALWREVERKFNRQFAARGIARHEFICSLFQNYDPSTHASDYLYDRTLAELALATLKAKGFVNTRVLQKGRTGSFFELWRECTGEPTTLYELCKHSMGLEKCSYSREALRVPAAARLKVSERARVLTQPEFNKVGDQFCRRFVASLRGPWRSVGVWRRWMVRSFNEMFFGNEVEVVNTTRSAVRHELCANPRPLDTLTALQALALNELRNDEWDTLLCVAETGEWLLKSPVFDLLRQRKKRRIAIIVADLTQTDGLVSLGCNYRKLNWWLHNQHMTLFIRGEGHVLNAFFFERRLRDPRIVPVMVEGGDAYPLLRVFFAYWIKADKKRLVNPKPIEDEEVVQAQKNYFASEKFVFPRVPRQTHGRTKRRARGSPRQARRNRSP